MFDNFMGVLREFMSDIGSGKVVVESLNHVSSPQEGSTFGFRCQAWVRRWQTRRKPGVSPGGRSSFLHWDCQRTRGIAHVMLKYSVALSTTAQQRLLLHKYDHVGRGVQQKPCTFPRLQTFIPVKSFCTIFGLVHDMMSMDVPRSLWNISLNKFASWGVSPPLLSYIYIWGKSSFLRIAEKWQW